ncbi:MAG TPA: cytochrome c oxidase subunit 3 [Bacteroidia bacterium]|nr:cytochrome c oxidase subunit 3 [Bacteroidia bacterium]
MSAGKKTKTVFSKAERSHPLKMLVYFVLAGISMLFFTLMTLFAFSGPERHLGGQKFPKYFLVSTVIILLSSFFLESARRAFREENGKKLLDRMMITMVLALAFSVAQVMGWMQLWDSGITLYGIGGIPPTTGTPSGAFLFLISGLHLLHLSVGLVFLFLTMFKVVHTRSDDVRSVIFFTNRLERTRIDMLTLYWHFLGGLWLILFLYFLWFFV